MQDSGDGGADRRRHLRAPIGLNAQLVIAGHPFEVPATLRDLSESGCFFATAAPVRLGWTVSLSFLVMPRDLCQAEGRVVRALTAQGFGVEFEKVNPTLLGLMRRLVATPESQRGWLLQALCDPHIEIGYLRRPDPTEQAAAESVTLPECPKCGCRAVAGRRVAGSAVSDPLPPPSCPRCGLTFALWTPAQAAEALQLDDKGQVLWAETLGAWLAAEKHDAFLKHCSLLGLLAVAGRCYRQRLDEAPEDAVAIQMQERVMAMATATFIRPPPVAARAITRNVWFWAAIVLFGVGGVALAAMQMTSWHRPPPPAPTLPAPAPVPVPVPVQGP
jgi:PilZ domain-containing protein